MKKLLQEKSMKCIFLVMLCFTGAGAWGQLWSNPITGSDPGQVSGNYTTGQTVASNITVSGISKGSGIAGNPADNRYNATGWTTGNSPDTNDYFQFTITPGAGYEIDFVSFVYTGQRSNQGPTAFAFRSSVDNYASNIGSPTATGTTISLSAAGYQNRTTAITFRFYGYSAGAASGTFSINDFTFNGTVTATGNPPTVVSTLAANTITTTSAGSGGNISSDGGITLTERGVVYATAAVSTSPTISNSKSVATGTAASDFTTTLMGLTPGTQYYYRAYATNPAGTSYGPTLNFWTASLATVTTTAQSNVTTTSATAGGNVTALGTTGSTTATNTTSTVTAKGIVWALSTSADPTITTNLGITNDGNGTGSYTSNLSGLSVNTSYKYRAYATSPEGTSYGSIVTFTTLNIVAPTVVTTAFNNQDDAGVNTANIKGGVTSNGNAAIVRRGFVWNSTGANLTVDNANATTVNDTDDTDAAFTTALSGLLPNTRYYYTAFANNGTATGYGAVNNFYTKAATPGVPVVNNPTTTTLTVTNDANGNPTATEYVVRIITPAGIRYINSIGGVTDTEVWLAGSTLASPLVVTGLSAGTSYTFDVKARNIAGIETPYSSTATESTASPSTPYFTLIDSDLEFGPLCINTTSPAGFFTFQANNVPVGQQIAVYSLEGFTYSLTENGTYQNGLFFNNTGSAITVYVKFTPTEVQPYPEEVGGVPGTIGVNSNNTSTLNIPVFGEGVNTPAIAATGTSSNVTVTGATLAGQLTQGCSAITGYGIEYSTTPAFGNGTGTAIAGSNLASGNFTVDVTGLTACTTYYYKAYVTDATGTYYGSQSTFTTPAVSAPTGTDATGITQTGFTANWNAVPGATGYYLDVSTNPNFETVFLSEDFSGVTAPAEGETDYNIAVTNTTTPENKKINSLTTTTGWTGTNVYAENGSVRVATGSGTHNLTTPTVNLSSTGGVATLYITAKHDVSSTTNKSITILHAANGSTFSATLQTIVLTDTFTTYSIPVTGGTANSKFRIQTAATSLNRFQISDIKVSNSQLIAGYNNLAVTTGTSQAVTGLNPDTQYYYRVRAYGTNCTSGNSNTVTVQTLKYLTLGETDNLAFGDVCTNTTETGSFTFTGSGMTGATLTVAALTGYTYSLIEEGTYTPTLSIPDFNGGEITIFVKFSPTAVQAYNGNITVQGSAPYAAATLTVPVTGAGIFTAAVATAEAAANITMTSASINATSTAGNCTTNTGYGIEYSTTNNFTPGNGTQIAGSGITDGAYTVTLQNLLPCKTYYYRAYTTTSGAPVYSSQLSFTTTAIAAPVSIDATEINATSFTANWETVENAAGYKLDVSTNPEFGIGNFGSDLIISEYIESVNGNNKALEIYNGTGAAVNLSGYSLRQQQNGSGAFGASSSYVFNFPAVSLPAGSVYILRSDGATNLSINPAHPSSLTTTLNFSQSAQGGPTVHFTGNDAIGLFKGSTMIDIVGVANNSANWGADVNLRRKASVLSPSTTYNTNEWTAETVANNTYISYLGTHSYNGGLIPLFITGYENLDVAGGSSTSAAVTGLDPFTTYYYRVSAYTADCTTAESETVEVITRGTVTWKEVNGTAKWVPEFYADGTTPIVINETIDTAIEANYNTGTNGVFTPKSVTLNSGIFTVASGTNFTVENEIINNAAAENFVVENNGNLIQNNPQNSNSGAITVKRNSSPLFRNDYIMWSSPVAGQDMVAFSPNTAAGRYYQYDSEGEGNGQYVNASGNFEAGKGYLIRMPNGGYNVETQSLTGTINGTVAQYNNGTATMVFNGKFTGVPNNGDISVTLSNNGGSYHLVGNPYPSPLNLPSFLAENEDVITGTVYVWRKKNASTVTSAYVTMNRTGQYVDNGEPNTDLDPLGVIRTGQGFIVQMVENPTDNEVVFNNSMRSENTSNQFFRNANNSVQLPESHGVYLNLTNAAGVYSQMYTGYIYGATDAPDNGIDAEYINDKPNVLSTVMAGKEYVIHGRALPFNTENTEPLQLRVASAGDYTIAIDRTEGSFDTQDIYLKDNLLNVVHNIKASPYTFTTTAGTFAGRFEVVYSPDGTLGTENPVADENSIIIFKQDNILKINSAKEEINEVTVFDIRGRKLYEAANVNALSTEVNELQAEQQALIVKVKTTNGAVISKKVIF